MDLRKHGVLRRTTPLLVFNGCDGRPLRPEYATRHVQALSQDAGLPVIRLHDLRHTSASLALTARVEMEVVSGRLWHCQISTTGDLHTRGSKGLGRTTAQQVAGIMKASSGAVLDAFRAQSPENSLSREMAPMSVSERARPLPAFPLVKGLVVRLNRSAPGGIRTPNLLIRKTRRRQISGSEVSTRDGARWLTIGHGSPGWGHVGVSRLGGMAAVWRAPLACRRLSPTSSPSATATARSVNTRPGTCVGPRRSARRLPGVASPASVERAGEADQCGHVVRPFEGGRVRDVALADAALELCHRLEA